MHKPRTKHSKRFLTFLSISISSTTTCNAFLSPRSILSSLPSLSLSNSNSSRSSSSLVSVVETGNKVIGRFGHSSIYLPPTFLGGGGQGNQLLIIGGQLDYSNSNNSSSGGEVEITNSVLKFNLGGELLWNKERESLGSSIPNNPDQSLQWQQGFEEQGFGFGSSTVSLNDQTVYLFGGIKSSTGDCYSNSDSDDDSGVIRSFNFTTTGSEGSEGWKSIGNENYWNPRTPPRRRQVSSVTIFNSTTLSNDFWVLGGIQDKYSSSSCSGVVGVEEEEIISGYMGIDRYSPLTREVESFEWKSPLDQPPISDYKIEVLKDGISIIVLGGQTRQGELVEMNKLLIFNTELREWSLKNTSGDIPLPRMGHVSTTLSSGSILIHGGLSSSSSSSSSSQTSSTPLSDLYLLTPPLEEEGEGSLWNWKKLVISNDSMNSPELVYHSMNQIIGETIIISFGLTNGGITSDEFWFLKVDELEGTFSWKDTFQGNQQAVDDLNKQQGLNKRGIEVVVNPKHDTSSTSSSSSAPAQTQQVQGSVNNNNNNNNNNIPSSFSSLGNAPSSTSSSFSSSPISSSSLDSKQNSLPSSSSSSTSSSSSSKSVTLGASIGATLGALTLLSLVIVLIRRSRSRSRSLQNNNNHLPPMMMTNSTTIQQQQTRGDGGGGAPLVSSLMFTRPVQKRMLSLGSTISERDNPFGDEFREQEQEQEQGERVNELGQLERTNSSTSTSTSTVRETITTTNTTSNQQQASSSSSSLLKRSKSSVQSIPFLSTITRDLLLSSPLITTTNTTPSPSNNDDKDDDEDKYTSPAPTISRAASSRRRTSKLPLPETPSELIGLAVTSDEGHQGGGGLPYRIENNNNSNKNGLTNWEQSFLKNQPRPRPGNEEGGGGIPAVLRPATPSTSNSLGVTGLRVRNADPFIDP
ncbi:hypothetical protein JCM3765_006869 [Sporobolomyces pararoseus]